VTRENGLEAWADNFDEGRVWKQEGDVLWIEQGVPDLEAEDVAPVVVRRLGRDDAEAYGEAEWALTEAINRFGPLPANPNQVGPYLDRCVRWAEGRARQTLVLWNVSRPEIFYMFGVAPRPPETWPRACSWIRPRGARATRARRHAVRRRARSPGRPSADSDPHEYVARRGGCVGVDRGRR
jgi:hypothetical protein